MSDEVRETQAGVAATVNENQEEQITKPAPKVKPKKEKDPKKVAAGKKLAEKNRQAKAALEREIKREIAEKKQQDENSASWLPEMSFQTVLSIVGVAFSAFEMYKNVFAQNQVRPERNQNRAKQPERSKDQSSERRLAKPRETPSVQKSEWCDNNNLFIYFRLLKMSEQNKLVKW